MPKGGRGGERGTEAPLRYLKGASSVEALAEAFEGILRELRRHLKGVLKPSSTNLQIQFLRLSIRYLPEGLSPTACTCGTDGALGLGLGARDARLLRDRRGTTVQISVFLAGEQGKLLALCIFGSTR